MSRLPKFTYAKPSGLAEALDLLQEYQGTAKVLSGGTDLIVAMKQRRTQPAAIVDLKNIAELNFVEVADNTLHIGSATSFKELLARDIVKQSFPGLYQAIEEVGSPLLRSRATMGGNLCLDTRCHYYNQSEFWRSSRPTCYKLGGASCLVTSEESCSATYAADVAPVLISLEARVKISSAAGARVIPVEDLFTGDGKAPLALQGPGEIISEIQVPLPKQGDCSLYAKKRSRGGIDFPLVGLAVRLRQGKQGHSVNMVAAGVGSGPVKLLAAAQTLQDKELTTDLIREAANIAAGEIKPKKTGATPVYHLKDILSFLVVDSLSRIQESHKGVE